MTLPEAHADADSGADPGTCDDPMIADRDGLSGTADPAEWAQLLDRAEADRQALIDLVVYAYDRARSSGVQERLAAGLGELGVAVLRPDGERYDPARHEAAGIRPTDDSSLHQLVAETELVGFADRGRTVRDPVVVVFGPA